MLSIECLLESELENDDLLLQVSMLDSSAFYY